MPIYEKTTRKLQHLTNKTLENEEQLAKIDKDSPQITSFYYNKNISKYYIFNRKKMDNIKSLTTLTINLNNFPEEYLPYINFVAISYGITGVPNFVFNGLNYSFFQVAQHNYRLEFTNCNFNFVYTAFFSLYFTINLPRDYNN